MAKEKKVIQKEELKKNDLNLQLSIEDMESYIKLKKYTFTYSSEKRIINGYKVNEFGGFKSNDLCYEESGKSFELLLREFVSWIKKEENEEE